MGKPCTSSSSSSDLASASTSSSKRDYDNKESVTSRITKKKGPWTSEEDHLLISCINRDGQGGWRTLPKRAGLQRCGKSCRLRWMNYLRPSIKRGSISSDEEDLILRLHRLLGNRWSLIAGRIPGRTDNDIKNYWNTHLKKKLLSQGINPRTHKPLLIYPPSTTTDHVSRTNNTTVTTIPCNLSPPVSDHHASFLSNRSSSNYDHTPPMSLLEYRHDHDQADEVFSSFLNSLINDDDMMIHMFTTTTTTHQEETHLTTS